MPSLLFRGAATGTTRPILAADLRCIGCCEANGSQASDAQAGNATSLIDVMIDEHIHGSGMYVSLYQHCAHK